MYPSRRLSYAFTLGNGLRRNARWRRVAASSPQWATTMTLLILGLVLFLGVHSTRIVADGWRSATIARLGEKPWKGLYSLLSIAGFVLLVIGYGAARQAPVVLYAPPAWARHLAALLTVPAFVLVVAAYVPGNAIKRAI